MDNFDEVIDYEQEYKNYLPNMKKAGKEYKANCPFHDDNEPSFCVDVKTGLWKCFGCQKSGNIVTFISMIEQIDTQSAFKKICDKYNIAFDPEKLKQYEAYIEEKTNGKYTVDDYAREKGFDIAITKSYLKLEDFKNGIKIPYFDESGKLITNRYRYAGKKFAWQKNGKVSLYGLDKWQEHKNSFPKNYIILVEGESDTQTLMFAGLPALGVPGATMVKDHWMRKFKDYDIYIHNEQDSGGTIFRSSICKALKSIGYKNKVYEFSCRTIGYKDPNEMWHDSKYHKVGNFINDIMDFGSEFEKLMNEAKKELDIEDVIKMENIPFPGTPIVKIPDGFNLTEEGIMYSNEKGESTLICRVVVVINRVMINKLTGDEELEFVFYKDNKWNSLVTTRSIINNPRQVIQLGDKGIPVTNDNSKLMSTYLGQQDELNMTSIKTQKYVTQFGWQGTGFLPYYPGDVEFRNIYNIDMSQFDSIGTAEEWIEYVKPLLVNDGMNLVMKISFAAPILKLLGYRSFGTYMWYASGCGKTASLLLMLSAWGDPVKLMGSFNSTIAGIEKNATLYCDLPFGLDEKQSSTSKDDFINSLIYMLGNGQSKMRSDKNGGLQPRQTWTLPFVATGEGPIINEKTPEGVSARLIELYIKPFDTQYQASEVYSFITEQYGTVGPMFLRYIIDNYSSTEGKKKLKESWKKIRDQLAVYGKDNIEAHVLTISLIVMVDYISNKVVFKNENIQESIQFGKRILKMLETKEEVNIVTKAYNFISGWVAANINSFNYDPKFETYGFRDKEKDGREFFYINPSILEPELEKNGYNVRKTLKGLAEQRLIKSTYNRKTDKTRYKVRMTHNGLTSPYIAIDVNLKTDDATDEELESIEKHEWNEICQMDYEESKKAKLVNNFHH